MQKPEHKQIETITFDKVFNLNDRIFPTRLRNAMIKVLGRGMTEQRKRNLHGYAWGVLDSVQLYIIKTHDILPHNIYLNTIKVYGYTLDKSIECINITHDRPCSIIYLDVLYTINQMQYRVLKTINYKCGVCQKKMLEIAQLTQM